MLLGYICPPGTPTVGNKNKADWCFHECPHQCVSPVLLGAMYDNERANHHIGTYISSSMLAGGGCARQTYYERTRDYYETPERMLWPFRGTIIHGVIEASHTVSDKYGWIQEMRMAVPIHYPDEPAPILDTNGNFTGDFNDNESLVVTLGGTCDAYNPFLPKPELHDFKSMSDKLCTEFLENGKPKPDWIKQLNIYRWLIAHTLMPTDIAISKYYPAPEVLVIQAISMMSLPATGRTSFGRIQVPGKTDRKGTFKIEAIPTMPLDEIEAFIRTEVYRWYRWLVLGEQPPVIEAERKWICFNCPFNGENDPNEPCWPTYERAQLAEGLLDDTAIDSTLLDDLL